MLGPKDSPCTEKVNLKLLEFIVMLEDFDHHLEGSHSGGVDINLGEKCFKRCSSSFSSQTP